MGIAMHTLKGTHIDYPIKRCTHDASFFVVVTILTIACVCASDQIYGQDSSTSVASHRPIHAFYEPSSVTIWNPSGSYWFISGIQRSFGMKALDEPWVRVGMKRSRLSLSVGASTLGWSHMRQWVSAAVVHYSTEGIAVSLGADYWLLQLRKPYHDDRAVVVRSHVLKTLHDDVHLSVRGQNLFGASWMVGNDPIERVLELDLIHTSHHRLLLQGGLSVSDQFPIDYHCRLSWKPQDAIAVNLQLGTMPSRIEMGIRIDSGGWLSGMHLSKISNESIGWRQNYWFGRVSS